MLAQVVSEEANQRKLHVEISPAEMVPFFDEALEMYREEAQIQGFRKGKAPRDVARTATEIEHAACNRQGGEAPLKLFDELAVRLFEIGLSVGQCLRGIVHQFGFGAALHIGEFRLIRHQKRKSQGKRQGEGE